MSLVHEIKLLTYEELLERLKSTYSTSNPLWIEIKQEPGDPTDHSQWVFPTYDEGDGLSFECFGDEEWLHESKDTYDITWRCWTWYPDGMEAFYPWEEEEK